MGARSCDKGEFGLIPRKGSVLTSCLKFQERIRIKSIAFEQRSKEIREKLAKISEVEQKRFSKKDIVDQSRSKYDSDDDKPAKKARKNDGEEKYDQIYSVSTSLGKFQLEYH